MTTKFVRGGVFGKTLLCGAVFAALSLSVAPLGASTATAGSVGHGGETYLDGDDVVHVFRTNGFFRLEGACTVDVLVVGGGGGGGTGRLSGGGGGGGGVVYTQNVELVAGSYEIVVGSGGSGGYTNSSGVAQNGTAGSNSSAFEIVAEGGGRGAKSADRGGDGASAGGAAPKVLSYAANTRNIYSKYNAEQGNNGGNATNSSSTVGYAGGGGGAGHAGYAGVIPYDATWGGRGGDGVQCDITGSAVYYGGGGGGGFSVAAGSTEYNQCVPGGLGGGGNGSGNRSITVVYDGADGEANTGGGGGGGSGGANGDRSRSGKGGDGGSGIVVVRCLGCAQVWREKLASEDATGGTIRKRGGYRVHTFAEDGVFVLPDDALVEVLVVGGGGGGGAGHSSGGGGAGGQVLYVTNRVFAAGSYSVTVGDGGAGAFTNSSGVIYKPDCYSTAGGESSIVFSSAAQTGDSVDASALQFAAEGGAPGGIGNNRATSGFNGGGASARCITTAICISGGTATDSDGFAGGASTNDSATVGFSGGGGGAGHAGYDGVIPYDDTYGGRGGDGIACGITGTVKYYGGGGGGGFTSSEIFGSASFDKCVPGGLGGGGNGSGYLSKAEPYAGGDGEANTGGGGGGGGACPMGSSSKMGKGGEGGSGIVILRYRCLLYGTKVLVR